MNKTVSSLQRGFTLVELLIVVIILALLAAIVVPQFATTTDDAREAALDSNLANIRSAIDLYYQQHNHYPSSVISSGGTCGGTAGTGTAATPTVSFLDQLAYYTNAAGQSCTQKDDGLGNANAFPFGPYLKKRSLPANPITSDDHLQIVSDGSLVATPDATGDGWKFDNASGKFFANDGTNDANGIPYSER